MPIGIISFELINSNKIYYEVSINISPLMRGKGLGQSLLDYATKSFYCDVKKCNRIYAEVKTDNIPSINLFNSAGYRYTPYETTHEKFIKYFLDCG